VSPTDRIASLSASPEEETDKRAILIRAAIRVFADRGFDAATLRDITHLAGANIAAVNYYFRSKDELLKSALESCLAPLNAARVQALNAIAPGGRGKTPTLEATVEALIRPVVELGVDDAGGRAPVRLLLQARALPRPFVNQILADQFDPVHSRFRAIFNELLPDLGPDEIALRYEFARGAVMQIVADLDPVMRPVPELRIARGPVDNERVIRSLVVFICSGMRAPPGGGPAPS